MKAIICRNYKPDKEVDLSEVTNIKETGMDTSVPYHTKVIINYGDEKEVFKRSQIVEIK